MAGGARQCRARASWLNVVDQCGIYEKAGLAAQESQFSCEEKFHGSEISVFVGLVRNLVKGCLGSVFALRSDSEPNIKFRKLPVHLLRFDILDIDRKKSWRGPDAGSAPFLFSRDASVARSFVLLCWLQGPD